MTGASRPTPGVLAAALATAGAAVLAYAGTLGFDFVWDDRPLIHESYELRQWSSLPRLLTSHFWVESQEHSPYYRPLVTASLFLDFRLWGASPLGFHLTNVLLHVAASLAVLALARRLAPGGLAPGLAAVLFALHPVHTESVAFVSGRSDVLATLGFVLTVVAYARWRATGGSGARLASVAGAAAALAAKEVAVTLPVILVAYDWAAARGGRGTGPEAPLCRPVRAAAAALGRHWPYLAMLGLSFAVRALVLAEPLGPTSRPWAPPLTRWLTTLQLVGLHAWTSLVPYPAVPFPAVVVVGWPPPWGWWAGIGLLVGLLLLTARMLSGPAVTAVGALWFWVTLLPSVGVNLLPLAAPLMAERFLYLPSVGVCLVVGHLLARAASLDGPAPGASANRLPALALGVLLVTALGLTQWRNEDWRDEERLFTRMIETAPQVGLPHINLGLLELRRGRIAEANDYLERAVERAPEHAKGLVALALTQTMLGRPERGLPYLQRALAAAPRDPNVRGAIGTVYLYRVEPAHALEHLRESLRLNPHQVHPALNLALALAKLERWGEAEQALEQALELVRSQRPDLPLAQRVAAEVYGGRHPERARAAWERYIAQLDAEPELGPAREADLRYARLQLTRLRGGTP